MALGQYTVQSKIDIGRPPEEVWPFVADPSNDPRWCHLVPQVTRSGHTADGQHRYTFIQRLGPIQRMGIGRVISASPPTQLRGSADVMGGHFRYEYRLEPVHNGTLFTHTNQVRWSGLMRLMHPVQRWMTKRIMDRQLHTLKTILENQTD